ncbi:MAG: glycosyltransferase family 2 protein [Gammaproteobacteria bacterium]|nr:glycosyltransferase family 2 protein [Gammaproteobacteria bacterium]
MKIAVITMVYNESVNLPIWINHYTDQCPGCELFVIDHGSDVSVRDEFTGINVLRLPRSDFDERRRADMVSRLQNALILEFDWVFYTDCDELVVSRHHDTLAEALENEPAEVKSVNAVGFNVWHDVDGDESAFDRSRSIGEQRRYAKFEKFMCKPFASRVPIHWIPGFHTSDLPPHFGSGYYLVHTKYIDYEESDRRRALTAGLEWSKEALDKGWSSHQRIDTCELTKKFKKISRAIAGGNLAEFDFEEEPVRFVAETVQDSKGNWRCDAIFDNKVVELPATVLSKLP